MTYLRALAILPTLAIACCAPVPPPPAPAPAPAPAVVAPVAPPVAITPRYDNWVDAPQTLGDWTYRDAGSMSFALFGQPGEGARFGIECRADTRAVRLVRASAATSPAPIVIRTETASRTLTANPEQGGTPQLVTSIQPRDPLLDAMALSRGRFAVETAGMETLYLPAWPEVTRVIEDCR